MKYTNLFLSTALAMTFACAPPDPVSEKQPADPGPQESTTEEEGKDLLPDNFQAISGESDPSFSGPITISINEDVAGSNLAVTNQTVSDILASSFSDGTDGDSFTGIAISSNATTSAIGVWEYSLNSGTNWHALPAVTNLTALVLNTSTHIRFNPTLNYNNSSAEAPLTVHALDSAYSGSFTTDSASPVTAVTNVSLATDGIDETGAALNVSIASVADVPEGAAVSVTGI
ncbi:MAG: hypothetical protein VX278_09635, partial [Myxococcota bacterium]|nr:hypothetical protein [Myxococcota bacterium]